MSCAARFALAALVALLAGAARADVPTPAEVRVGLVVGANRGAGHRHRLRFAEADAERLAAALSRLGGFAAGDVRLLRQPDRAALLGAARELEARIAAARRAGARRALLLFYWSGHAGERGLELGDELMSFAEVRRLLDGSAADVRVAFVDACLSGNLTAAKGASPQPAGFELTVSSSPSPDGTAIVTSTAPGETALESAELRGSFFSHHLTAGLHGAADADGDGKVTLLEAYRYAYERTVAQSVLAAGLAQHPTYALALQGKGDLVLTEPVHADGALVFPAVRGAGDRWIVVARSAPQVFEVFAEAGRAVRLGLSAGDYRLVRADDREVLVGAFRVERGQTISVHQVSLSRTPYLGAVTKGGERVPVLQRLELSIEGGARSSLLPRGPAAPAGAAALTAALGTRLALQARAGYAESSQRDGGLAFTTRIATFDAGLAWVLRPPKTGGLELAVGPLLGFGGGWQRLQRGGGSARELLLRGGLQVNTTIPLSGRMTLVARAAGVETRYRLDGARRLRPGVEGGLGLGWELWP